MYLVPFAHSLLPFYFSILFSYYKQVIPENKGCGVLILQARITSKFIISNP